MSLAPSIAVPRASFNPLPLYIGLFCLLWSFAFVAGKIGVTDCPPLILLTARFSLAGILILGISALRRDAWSLSWRDTFVFAILGIANNALYLVSVHKAAFLLPLEEAGRISGVVRTRFCARRGLRRSILHASSRQTCSKREQWAWESIRRRRR